MASTSRRPSAIGSGPDLSLIADGRQPSFGLSSNGGGWQDDVDEQQQQQQQQQQERPAAVELQGPAEIGAKRPAREKDEYVLLFEFNDGHTSRTESHSSWSPSLRVKEEDPVQLLISAAEDHVPINPETAVPDGETPKKRRIRLEYLMNNPDERPSIIEVIEELQGQPWYKNQIVPGGHRTVAERPARYEGLTFALSQELVNALWATRQIEEFYLHQAEALNALDEGKNIIVSTSTSSGKSLIYQIPVLRALEEDPTSTAMYIFPTKALAQDQRRTLQDLLMNCEGLEETIVATYDGDTDKDIRHDIRERASVIFTNPDMLHQSILPSENLWRRYLRGLRFVVVDELHMYNGLFGAHVSYVMRRLRRICAALGNRNVKFISCSATVANPREHMQTLFGVEDVEVITEDGSPAGRKEWIVWNPPLIDDRDPKQGRVSAYAEVSRVFRHLLERGVRTIIFTKVRRTCEIVINQVRNDLLLQDRADIANKVMSYRSGYSPQDRRKIEQDMFKVSSWALLPLRLSSWASTSAPSTPSSCSVFPTRSRA
ncbi:hypothetical protein L7F22_041650 [Adiantum nelumboides]|nr:hypothetical protein [Adiantum nelumboides]